MKKTILVLLLMLFTIASSYSKDDPKYGTRVFNGTVAQIYLKQSFADTNGDGILDVMICTFTLFTWGTVKTDDNGNPIQETYYIPFKIRTKSNTLTEARYVSDSIIKNTLESINTTFFLTKYDNPDLRAITKSVNIITTVKDNNNSAIYKLISDKTDANLIFIK